MPVLVLVIVSLSVIVPVELIVLVPAVYSMYSGVASSASSILTIYHLLLFWYKVHPIEFINSFNILWQFQLSVSPVDLFNSVNTNSLRYILFKNPLVAISVIPFGNILIASITFNEYGNIPKHLFMMLIINSGPGSRSPIGIRIYLSNPIPSENLNLTGYGMSIYGSE